MPKSYRDAFRNVHIYNGVTREIVGGLEQNGSITEAVFLNILSDILLISDKPLQVIQRSSERIIKPTSNALEHGVYDIYSDSRIVVNNEPWIPRLMPRTVESMSGDENEDPVELAVRKGDGGCVITGMANSNADSGWWGPWKAVHIFPLEEEHCWDEVFAQHIPDTEDATTGCAETNINTLRNALLMSTIFEYNEQEGQKDQQKRKHFVYRSPYLTGRILWQFIPLEKLKPRSMRDKIKLSDNTDKISKAYLTNFSDWKAYQQGAQ